MKHCLLLFVIRTSYVPNLFFPIGTVLFVPFFYLSFQTNNRKLEEVSALHATRQRYTEYRNENIR